MTIGLMNVYLGANVSADVDDEDGLRSGLVGDYRTQSLHNSPRRKQGQQQDALAPKVRRTDPQVSFAWNGANPDRRLPSGPFQATWRGYLSSQSQGPHTFHAFVAGRVRVELNGTKLLEGSSAEPRWISSDPVELTFDDHPIAIEFQSLNQQARISLFWSGPQFQLEPITERQFLHNPADATVDHFEQGEQLVRALRCAACHAISGEPSPLPAPSLTFAGRDLDPDWLLNTLSGQHPSSGTTQSRNMPHFGLSSDDGRALAAFILSSAKKESKDSKLDPKASAAEGEQLVHTMGCLACHQLGDLGTNNRFGGGDLAHIADKRAAPFFFEWLDDPAAINSQHRMPVFELSKRERSSLSLFLQTLESGKSSGLKSIAATKQTIGRGQALFEKHRCGICHEPKVKTEVVANRLTASSDWESGCLGEPRADRPQPGYRLGDVERQAIRGFVSSLAWTGTPDHGTINARLTLAESNCFACHARGLSLGLAPSLSKVVSLHQSFAELVPAMTPPSLNSVGDKLQDQALVDVISGKLSARRPWLKVRMPKYRFRDKELQAILHHFIDSDRIPEPSPGRKTPLPFSASDNALELAAARLVTPDGFGCTSCHQVGKVIPAKAPLNALGPDLSQPLKIMRREWFDRWVRNPARIVPRMEMPSVQVPVRGVLDDNLDQQLAAVWEVLNKPGFQPPTPNPVRILRRTGESLDHEPAVYVTDVVKSSDSVFVKPLLIGLPNRHNVLFDLERNRLVGWWMGDAARERTEGKTWFWEPGARDFLQAGIDVSDIILIRSDQEFEPVLTGQFLTEFDSLQHEKHGIAFSHRLKFDMGRESTMELVVSQKITPSVLETNGISGFLRTISVTGVPPDSVVGLRLLGTNRLQQAKIADQGRSLALGVDRLTLRVLTPLESPVSSDGLLRIAADKNQASLAAIEYSTDLPVYKASAPLPDPTLPEPIKLNVAPGFEALRVPLPAEVMPTAIACDSDGRLAIASLKGDVWMMDRPNSRGVPANLRVVCDGLAAPYGVLFDDQSLLVINKYALLRVTQDSHDLPVVTRVVSGWGHTADYHDWAVGIVRDSLRNLYVALPCQQDERPSAAANWRGIVARLVPLESKPRGDLAYTFEPISKGHRFPMGIAMNRAGDLFVTDNQGNYNPFNELNHVRPGAHFGFINALDKTSDKRPPLTPSTINIPHPWTRSVNGICFLEVPAQTTADTPPPFGPFTGHLIGCEYDTRRLIRMSLQKVRDTFQGAVYPFSWDPAKDESALLGPLVCCVSHDGDLYVGSVRDSGWGAGNNVGELVRLRPNLSELPVGISEVVTTPSGFDIQFTRPVDAKLAADVQRYSLSSYTKQSTPAYGGPDLNRKVEKISAVAVADDLRRVSLRLNELRPGYVYEFHLQSLVCGDQPFFPAEAHYTLNEVIGGE